MPSARGGKKPPMRAPAPQPPNLAMAGAGSSGGPMGGSSNMPGYKKGGLVKGKSKKKK